MPTSAAQRAFDHADAPRSQIRAELIERAVELCLDVAATTENADAEREALFSTLDALLERLSDAEIDALLADPRYLKVRRDVHHIRAAYEYVREFALAREIVAAGDVTPVDDFRSADWYDKAHAFEIDALKRYQPMSALFVGGGPYPTTAIAYALSAPNARVATLERYADAADLARRVAAVGGLERIEVIEDDALTYAGYGDFDCVVIGLVVGASDAEKREVVAHALRATPASTLLSFRTAVGLGRVVYPSIDPEMLAVGRLTMLENPPHKSFTLALLERDGAAA